MVWAKLSLVHVVIGGADAVSTVSLLKLKVIACMNAVNWFLAIDQL